MTFELALMGAAIHILVWEKLPEWGNWFNALLSAMPGPLQSLYEMWRCPYCAGFWIALALHALTGFWTIPALAQLPAYLGLLALPLGWFLDALVTAMLVNGLVLVLMAIRLPAMKAHLMKEDFMKQAFGKEPVEPQEQGAR